MPVCWKRTSSATRTRPTPRRRAPRNCWSGAAPTCWRSSTRRRRSTSWSSRRMPAGRSSWSASRTPSSQNARLLLTFDNHNSVVGIREFARARGAQIDYVPVVAPDMRADDSAVDRLLDDRRGSGRGLFAYPAQSNFSGVRHPLDMDRTGAGPRLARLAGRRRLRADQSPRPRPLASGLSSCSRSTRCSGIPPASAHCSRADRRWSNFNARGSRAERSRSRRCRPTGTTWRPDRRHSKKARPATSRFRRWTSVWNSSSRSESTSFTGAFGP